MEWIKKGLILKPSDIIIEDFKSHLALPVCEIINDKLKVYFSQTGNAR